MQAVFKKEDITKALGVTLGVVEKKQTLPILANVLLEVNESGFHLTATDLESEVRTSGPLESVSSEGRTTTSAKKLNDLCRLIPDGSSIEIKLSGDKIQLKTPSGKYSLATLPSDDFPIFESQESGEQLKINSKDLRKIFSTTSFAMGNQDWRHYLNGLYLELKDDFLTAVATDAHRLAINTFEVSAGSSFSGIVPRKSVNEMTKFLADADGEVSLLITDSSIELNTGNITFKSKLIDGNYPDFNQVIPSGDSFVLEVDVKELSESLSRVSVLSSDKYRGIRLNVSDGSLMVSANNPEEEAGEETLGVNYSGENIDIAFNVNYLQEILSHQEGNVCNIKFFGSDKSCLMLPPNADFPKYVVMPLLI